MDGSLSAINPATDSHGFRDCLGRFATGVTVVTAQGPQGPVGVTANSFASLSLDPPLVLWSPAKSSSRFQIFSEADRFAIHVLGKDQSHVAGGFAKDWAAFDGLGLTDTNTGCPIFEACLARYICTRHAVHEGGDHVIVVGQVEAAAARAGDPLVFHAGQYGAFTAAG